MWPISLLWPRQTSIFSSMCECWLVARCDQWCRNVQLGHNRPRRQTQKRNFIFIPFVLVQTVRGDVVKLFMICYSWCEVPLASWRPRERVRAGQSDGTAAPFTVFTPAQPPARAGEIGTRNIFASLTNCFSSRPSRGDSHRATRHCVIRSISTFLHSNGIKWIYFTFHLCCNSITTKPFISDVISELQRHTFCLTSL